MLPLLSAVGRSAVQEYTLRCVPNVSAKKLSSVEAFGMRDAARVLVHAGDSRRMRHQGMAERRRMVAAPENPSRSMIIRIRQGVAIDQHTTE